VGWAVLKFGGSLAEEPESFTRLTTELPRLAAHHRLLLVPGGGRFADAVRGYDEVIRLSKEAAHRLAILAMDQFGLLLSDRIENSHPVSALEEVIRVEAHALPILLPSRLMVWEKALPPSWDVTSDSISAYIARALRAERLILMTDVDGIFTADPKIDREARLLPRVTLEQLSGFRSRTSVDLYLWRVLEGANLKCHVVNGRDPSRIREILEGRSTISTEILV